MRRITKMIREEKVMMGKGGGGGQGEEGEEGEEEGGTKIAVAIHNIFSPIRWCV